MATLGAGFSPPFFVDRVVYGRITLMSVLIVYDGWQELRFRDIVVVTAGQSSPCSSPTCSRRRWPGRLSLAGR
jgi:hypothetical protein